MALRIVTLTHRNRIAAAVLTEIPGEMALKTEMSIDEIAADLAIDYFVDLVERGQLSGFSFNDEERDTLISTLEKQVFVREIEDAVGSVYPIGFADAPHMKQLMGRLLVY